MAGGFSVLPPTTGLRRKTIGLIFSFKHRENLMTGGFSLLPSTTRLSSDTIGLIFSCKQQGKPNCRMLLSPATYEKFKSQNNRVNIQLQTGMGGGGILKAGGFSVLPPTTGLSRETIGIIFSCKQRRKPRGRRLLSPATYDRVKPRINRVNI